MFIMLIRKFEDIKQCFGSAFIICRSGTGSILLMNADSDLDSNSGLKLAFFSQSYDAG
jgi:hypothetical protein